MSEDPASRRKTARVDVSFKVQLQYPDRDTFVERFSINVSRTGLFVRARDPAPIGSRVHFEYRLQDDSRVLRGVGIVRWVRKPEHAKEPDDPPGMGIEFVDLDPTSEEIVTRIVSQHGEGQRAPKRAAGKAKVFSAPPPAAGPKTLADAELDSDEESALDVLVGEAPKQPKTEARKPLLEDREPTAEKPKKAIDPRPVVLLDLSGTAFLGALAITAGDTIDRFEEQRIELPLPSLLGWMGSPGRVAAAARRLGLSVGRDDAGEPLVVLDGEAQPLGGVLGAALTRAAEPFRDALQDARGCVAVVPAASSPALLTQVQQSLAGAGLTGVTLLADAVAVLHSLGVALPPSSSALVVQVSHLETRIALVRSPGDIQGARSTPFGSFWEADNALAERAAVRLNREHGIDVDDDASLREALVAEVRKVRQQHAGTDDWTLGVAGAQITASQAEASRWTVAASEAVALAAADLLADYQVPPADVAATVLVTDEMPWPGLIETFEATVGLSPILPDSSPWIRIDGASRSSG